jgi:hypothetical protein
MGIVVKEEEKQSHQKQSTAITQSKMKLFGYRARYAALLPASAKALMELEAGPPHFLTIEPVQGEEILMSPPIEVEDYFDILMVPKKTQLSAEVKAWMDQVFLHEQKGAKKMGFNENTFIYNTASGLILEADKNREDVIIGLAYYVYHLRLLKKLEKEVCGDREVFEKDVSLMRIVDNAAPQSLKYVNDRACVNVLRRREYLLLRKCMESPENLSSRSIDIIDELCENDDIYNRLEIISEYIEMYEDLYEEVGSRIAEYSYFYREYKLEMWIIIILLFEVVLIVGDIYFNVIY